MKKKAKFGTQDGVDEVGPFVQPSNARVIMTAAEGLHFMAKAENEGWSPSELDRLADLYKAKFGTQDGVDEVGPFTRQLFKDMRPIAPQFYAWRAMRSLVDDADEQQRLAEGAINDIEKRKTEPDEVKALAGELGHHVLCLLVHMGMGDAMPFPDKPWPERDGMLWLDALGADYLEKIGDTAKDDATALRKAQRKRWNEWTGKQLTLPNIKPRHWRPVWRLWFDPDHKPTLVRFARALARALWLDVVKPRLARALAPALPGYDVVTSIVRLTSLGAHSLHGETWPELHDRRGRVVTFQPTNEAPQLPAKLVERAVVLHKLAAAKLLRYAVHRGHEQRYLEDVRLYDRFRVKGGWSGLAREIGPDTRKFATELREAAEILRHAFVEIPGYKGACFAWGLYGEEAPGRQCELELHLLGPLRPGFVLDLKRLPLAMPAHARHLIPFPRQLPPMVGRSREHAALANLQILMLREMRLRADELAEKGSVEIAPPQWAVLGDEAKVPFSLLPKVYNAWQTGDDKTPAFLASAGHDRFTLATPTYSRELATLIAAGRDMITGAKAGKRPKHWRKPRKKKQ